jgi:hypothetical protein
MYLHRSKITLPVKIVVKCVLRRPSGTKGTRMNSIDIDLDMDKMIKKNHISRLVWCPGQNKGIATVPFFQGPAVNSTSDYTLWALYRSYFKCIRANIELQVYSVTC